MSLQTLFGKQEQISINEESRKWLITGIGGMVASHLADYCLEQGDEVFGTMRWFEETNRVDHLRDNPNFHLIPMDLNDLSSCINAVDKVKPDYISHLAAQSYVSESFDYPYATIQTNVLGTLNLLEAIRMIRDKDKLDENIPHNSEFDPVIHICSSSEVYGLVKKEDIPIKETQNFNPANPYAVGKVGTDMLALLYFTNYGMKTIRTRMFTHTSGRRSMMSAECNFARQIARIEKGLQEPIVKHGNLNSVRTWADARDAVRAYYLLVKKGKAGEVYNIGGKTTKTIGQMLDYMVSLSTKKYEITKEQDPKLLRPYDVTLQIPDISKFEKDVPEWKPIYSFHDTILDVLNGWRKKVNVEG